MATVNDKSDPLVQAASDLFPDGGFQIVRVSGAERLKGLLDVLQEDIEKLHRNDNSAGSYQRAMAVIAELRTFKV